MHEDMNMYITRDRLNETSFSRKLDPISKNVMHRQNPRELVFKDISTFDAQNLLIGSLIKEIEIRKKDLVSELIKKTPNSIDFEIESRLNALKKDNDDNKNFVDQNNLKMLIKIILKLMTVLKTKLCKL